MYLSVGCLVVNCEHPTDKYIRHAHTHIHNITATYQLNDTNREVVTALSTKDSPLKMVKQL
jgi:hypothetical protein